MPPNKPTLATIERRIDTWREIATGGDNELFRKRLARDGVDLDEISPLLGDVNFTPRTRSPVWLNIFSWAAEAMVSPVHQRSTTGVVDSDRLIPFEELFLPVAAAARKWRDRSTDGSGKVLSERAEGNLQRALVARLSRICAPSLYDGFTLARMAAHNFALGISAPGGTAKRDFYDGYIASLRESKLRTYFLDRPVLARLVGTVIALWSEATDRFVQRLEADLQAIRNTLHSGDPLGRVAHLDWGLSDPHNGGETVCRLTFESGVIVGYKPKDLRIDVAWMRLLDWLAARGGPPSARVPRVLARQGYGWVEWLEPTPCRNESEARVFFQRAGAMLCLFHLLNGADFHWENVLAIGDAPAPVDLETLLQPKLKPFSEPGLPESADMIAFERLSRCVLATGYLPQWMVMPGGEIADVGGLNQPDYSKAQLRFSHINTDDMQYDYASVPDAQLHFPALDGRPLAAAAYAEEISCGFQVMYRFLMGHRHELVAPNGPLNEFEDKVIRIVLRPTTLYATILDRSLRRQCLSNGIDWSLNFDFLSRFSSSDEKVDPLNRVQVLERRALEQLDIPYFVGRTDCLDVALIDGTKLDGFFTETSLDRVRYQVGMLSEEALSRELALIHFALNASDHPHDLPRPRAWSDLAISPSVTATQREATIAWVRDIAAIIGRSAIRNGDSAAWIGVFPLQDQDRYQLSEIGKSLYSGASGVAVFLAAVHRVTGSLFARNLALYALQPLRELLNNSRSRARLVKNSPIGAGDGLGAFVYAVTKTAEFLDDSSLLSEACRCAELITLEAIARDRRVDILHGSAGALLALLALHRIEPHRWLLERALDCGHHVLNQQVACDAGGRAWKTYDGKLLTGFSHGAAGIAYALLRLYGVVGDDSLRTAAEDAIAYETAVYSPDKRNWPDFREVKGGEMPDYPCQWCHGASGIGLARLGILDALTNAQIRRDIDVAVEITAEMPRVALDHLCCGNFGRLEFLFTAGRRLNRTGLVALARARAYETVAHARKAGGFNWRVGNDQFNLGFFTGLSGVGYTLLRFAHPDVLPSVMLWD